MMGRKWWTQNRMILIGIINEDPAFILYLHFFHWFVGKGNEY